MKSLPFLAVFLGLAACGTPAKPDPRVVEIQSQHQQIVAAQKESAAQSKNPELVRVGRVAEAKQRFDELVKESEANLASVGQLDAAKSQDPAQVALVGTVASKEAELLKQAKATLTYNQYIITTAEKLSHKMDSLNQVINGLK